MNERHTRERSSTPGAPSPAVAATPEPAGNDAPANTVGVYDRPEKIPRRSNAAMFVGVVLVILVVAGVLFFIYWLL